MSLTDIVLLYMKFLCLFSYISPPFPLCPLPYCFSYTFIWPSLSLFPSPSDVLYFLYYLFIFLS